MPYAGGTALKVNDSLGSAQKGEAILKRGKITEHSIMRILGRSWRKTYL